MSILRGAPALILPSRYRLDPLGPLEINPHSELARGLVFGTFGHQLIGPRVDRRTAQAAYNGGIQGFAHNRLSGANGYLTASGFGTRTVTKATLAWGGLFGVNNTTTTNGLLSVGASGSNAAVCLHINGGSDRRLGMAAGSLTSATSTYGVAINAGSRIDAVGVYDGGLSGSARGTAYLAGAALSIVSSSLASSAAALDIGVIGSVSFPGVSGDPASSGPTLEGQTDYSAVWLDRALTADEVAEFNRNPFQVVRRRANRIYSLASIAATIVPTLTGAITNPMAEASGSILDGRLLDATLTAPAQQVEAESLDQQGSAALTAPMQTAAATVLPDGTAGFVTAPMQTVAVDFLVGGSASAALSAPAQTQAAELLAGSGLTAELSSPMTALDGSAVHGVVGSADVAAPMQSAVGTVAFMNFGDAMSPMAVALATINPGRTADAALVAPHTTAQAAVFSAYPPAEITLLAQAVTANGQTGELVSAALTSPRPEVEVSLGFGAFLRAPAQFAQAIAQTGGAASASLSAPMAEVEVALPVQGLASAALAAPMAEVSGAIMVRGASSAALASPMPIAQAEMLVQGVATAALNTPAPIIAAGLIVPRSASASLEAPHQVAAGFMARGTLNDGEALAPMPVARGQCLTGQVADAAMTLADLQVEAALGSGGMAFAALVGPAQEVLAYTLIQRAAGDTYLINTETLAASRYPGYGALAMGEVAGRLYVVTATGIYRVEGDTDAGTPVAATVRTGLDDFGTDRLKRVATAYLGARTSGSVDMTVAGDGEAETGTYAATRVTPAGLKTAKVKLGRGVRSRYWQVEISNVDGSTFELESLTLDEIQTARRAS